MWVSIKIVPKPSGTMWLPMELWEQTSEQVIRLRYGTNETSVRIQPRPSEGGKTSAQPAGILICPAVARRLSIRTEPVYRARLHAGTLEIGPVLGLLLGNRNHWYDEAYLTREPERATLVYQRTGGLICALSSRTVSLRDRRAHGLFYSPGADQWLFGPIPIPRVMHRRSFHTDTQLIRRLELATGATIFNSRRYDKWELYQILSQDVHFRQHLPETKLIVSAADVEGMARRHGSVILKPSDLSRGRGIVFVAQQTESLFQVTDCRQGDEIEVRLVDAKDLPGLIAPKILLRPYLCQQLIDLAKVGGAPFDVRVVMQRDPHGEWYCNGIECRLAGPGQRITNIAHGGRALRLDEAVFMAYGDSRDQMVVGGQVVALSKRFCQLMDQTGGSFAEFGIDIGLDREGGIWFIEANVLPTFKGFKLLDPQTYQRILTAPLLYASHLAGFGADALPDAPVLGEEFNPK